MGDVAAGSPCRSRGFRSPYNSMSPAALALAWLCATLLPQAARSLRTPITLTASDPGVIGINGHGAKVASLGDFGIDLAFHINLSLPKGMRLDAGARSSSDSLLQADVTAALANMSAADAEALLDGFRKAAGPDKAPFIWTVTDGGMIDFAQNMLTSLDDVSSAHERLLVGMGRDVCKRFDKFKRTTCVEIFHDSGSEDAVTWGTEAYFNVVLRKHVILTMLATCGLTSVSVFTDPDIVFLQDPVEGLLAVAGDNDIVFSPNNYLDRNPESALDVAEDYARRGMEGITIGPKGRRADINTGLLYLRSSPLVNDLMLRTLLIFKSEGGTHGHYQQYSLVAALKRVPEAKLSVAPGDVFVNGNVFWGHRKLLDPSKVVSIHANWMGSTLKRTCLQTAGLWKIGGSLLNKEAKWLEDVVVMDEKGKTVQSCAAGDGTFAVGKPKDSSKPEATSVQDSTTPEPGRSSANIPLDMPIPSAAAEAAQLGDMPPGDVAALVGSIKKTAGDMTKTITGRSTEIQAEIKKRAAERQEMITKAAAQQIEMMTARINAQKEAEIARVNQMKTAQTHRLDQQAGMATAQIGQRAIMQQNYSSQANILTKSAKDINSTLSAAPGYGFPGAGYGMGYGGFGYGGF